MTTPPEDLVIAARALDPNVFETVARITWEPANDDAPEVVLDWRIYVHPAVRKLWGRLGLEARLAVYLTARVAMDDPHTFDDV